MISNRHLLYLGHDHYTRSKAPKSRITKDGDMILDPSIKSKPDQSKTPGYQENLAALHKNTEATLKYHQYAEDEFKKFSGEKV